MAEMGLHTKASVQVNCIRLQCDGRAESQRCRITVDKERLEKPGEPLPRSSTETAGDKQSDCCYSE